jgi:predicted amidohydrolase YtcJ
VHKRVCWLLVSLLFANILPEGRAAGARRKAADIVFRNGAVYTVAATRGWASAVAISGGRIVYVGSEGGLDAWVDPGTTVVDLEGKMVLPGFHDSHVHPVSGGMELAECNLNELTTREQVLDAVGRYARENPGKPWIRGGGFQLPLFPQGNPSKSLLDAIVPDRPVYLSAADGHSAWVNSRALKIAGVTAKTEDPPNGRIERDPASGEPSGTLREDAMGLVAKHLPPYAADDYVAGLRRGLEMANRFGITSLQEASAGEDSLKAYAELDRRGELTARVVASMHVDTSRGAAQIPGLLAMRDRFRGRRLRANTVKIFADGVIEGHTAALLEPYLDRPGYRGKPNIDPDGLKRLVTALDQEGFQVHIHAIGDFAIREALDAFESARTKNGGRDSRHHIAHLQLIDPRDLPRFRRLGVIANFQPLWAFRDAYIADLTEPVLGPERSRWLYPINSVVRTGAVVACGSDWSVTSMNPLEAIQVAVTRRDPAKESGPAWIPEELVDLSTMIAAYTINGAYVNFQEAETGSIEVGKAADLTVLDRNLFEIPANEIGQAKVVLTLLEGQVVYRDPAFSTEFPPANRRGRARTDSVRAASG